MQCWKFPQVRRSEADNFGGFWWFFFNFMFMIWDSRHEDLQLFWLSFRHCIYALTSKLTIQHWFRQWLGAWTAPSHYWNQCWIFFFFFFFLLYNRMGYELMNLHMDLWKTVSTFQCRRKTFMVHQTFVWWALYIPHKFVKSPIRHLGLAIGNVRRVRHFSSTLTFTCILTFNFDNCPWPTNL